MGNKDLGFGLDVGVLRITELEPESRPKSSYQSKVSVLFGSSFSSPLNSFMNCVREHYL